MPVRGVAASMGFMRVGGCSMEQELELELEPKRERSKAKGLSAFSVLRFVFNTCTWWHRLLLFFVLPSERHRRTSLRIRNIQCRLSAARRVCVYNPWVHVTHTLEGKHAFRHTMHKHLDIPFAQLFPRTRDRPACVASLGYELN